MDAPPPLSPEDAWGPTIEELRLTVRMLRTEVENLRHENRELKKGFHQLQAAGLLGNETRLAALNLMEDAILARDRAERASQAWRESEERYRMLFESIDEGFCVIEVLFDHTGRARDYRFIRVNPAFIRQTGLHDAVGRRVLELVPGHETHWFRIYGEIALHGTPARFEQAAAQLGRYYDVYAFRVGKPEEHHVAVLFNDVSGRRQAEEILRVDSRKQAFLVRLGDALRSLRDPVEMQQVASRLLGEELDADRVGYAEADEGGDTVVVTRHYARGVSSIGGRYRIADYGPGMLREFRAGRTVVRPDIANDPLLTEEEKKSHAALDLGATLNKPLLKESKLAAIVFVHFRTAHAFSVAEIAILEETAERIWTAIERARSEAALRESEERLRLIVENARDYAIFSLTLDRRVTSWNVGAKAILGYSVEEILGQTGDVIFTLEDQSAGVPQHEAGTAIAEGRSSDERWHRRKDGSVFWGSGVMMAMRDENGAAIGLVKIFRDHTPELRSREALEQSSRDLWQALQEMERARAEAEEAGQAKDRFLAILSHELRTPLTPILIATQMMARRKDLPPGLADDLAMIRRNIETESNLVEDLLDVTRIARGKMEFQLAPVDLHQVVRHAVEICQADMETKSQRFVMILQAEKHHAQGDVRRLQQVIWNLLKNASKFTPEGGRITLRTFNEPDRWLVQISDTGKGIEAGALATIFEAFTQESARITRQYGGLGLGLAIARAIVEGHGGELRAESDGDGKGAIFTCSLPVADFS